MITEITTSIKKKAFMQNILEAKTACISLIIASNQRLPLHVFVIFALFILSYKTNGVSW